MHTPTIAILWEVWRLSRFELIIRLTVLSAFLISGYLLFVDDEQQLQLFRGMMLLMIGASSLFFNCWMNVVDNRKPGFGFRLGFTRPVSTAKLVAIPMIYNLCVAATCMIVPFGLFRIITQTQFAIVGPTAFIICVSACFIAATWSPSDYALRLIALFAVGAGTISAFAWWIHYQADALPFLFAMGKPEFFDLAWYHYAVLLAITVAAVAVTIQAVDRQRHGERFGWPSIPFRFGHVARRWFAVPCPQSGPNRAHFGYEMRRTSGKVTMAGCCLAIGMFVLTGAVQWIASPSQNVGIGFWLIALIFGMFAFHALASDWTTGLSLRQGTVIFSTFEATRGLADDRLAAIKLLAATISCLFGFGVLASGAGLFTLIWAEPRDWADLLELELPILNALPWYGWAILIYGGLFVLVGNCAQMMNLAYWSPMYGKRLLSIGFLIFAHCILAILDANHDWSLRPLWLTYGWTFAVLMPTLVVWISWRGLSSQALSKGYLAISIGFWAVFVLSACALYAKLANDGITPALSASSIALCIGVLIVPLVAIMNAPLALASYRHR